MKKSILMLSILAMFMSCEKDECGQDAMCTKLTNGSTYSANRMTSEMITICHYGQTMQINENALAGHLSHGDTEGECQTLSDNGLKFRDGEVVEIDCKYSLPFIYVDDNGAQWLYD